MHAERHVVHLTTASDGSATGYTPNVTGRVLEIHYAKNDFANGVDFTITAELDGDVIATLSDVNASATWRPRVQSHDAGGAEAYLDGDSNAEMLEPKTLVNDRVKIVVAAGGSVKTGAVHVIVG